MDSTTSSLPRWPNLGTGTGFGVANRSAVVPAGPVLGLVAVCAVPVVLLLGLGRVELAARCFWGMLGLVGLGLVLAGRPWLMLACCVGLLPLVNLLRGLGGAPYNVPMLVLGVALLHCLVRGGGVLARVWRTHRLVRWLWLLLGLYYGLSLVNSGQYTRNLRMFEMLLALVAVLVLGQSRSLLAGAFCGLVVTGLGVGVSLLPQTGSLGRLGQLSVADQTLGNPVQLGMVLAVGLLGLVLDRGWWLGLERSGTIRWTLMGAVSALLLLTTSRAAWLVSLAGLGSALLWGRRQRGRLMVALLLATAVGGAAWFSPLGGWLEAGMGRTFGAERSWRQRSSGRTDQWQVSYRAVTATPERLLVGYGPGLGPLVYARYSEQLEDVRYGVGQAASLHSWYMQVLVETGLVGLTVWMLWLGLGAVAVWRASRAMDRLLPWACFLGYALLITTVSGHDTMAGAALGLGLLPTRR
jgi:O-antigen ligase